MKINYLNAMRASKLSGFPGINEVNPHMQECCEDADMDCHLR